MFMDYFWQRIFAPIILIVMCTLELRTWTCFEFYAFAIFIRYDGDVKNHVCYVDTA